MLKHGTQSTASQLFHNKFVVVLGDSIQRSVYKDLVLLLQRDAYLNPSQLKSKGELSFERDCLVEGGRLGLMNNGTEYKEVRQYRTDHHLVRFYFVTRIFSRYMESILADFKNGIKPDFVIVNSCVWDVSRYNREWAFEYKENLNRFFLQLKTILPPESLVLWNMTMPLGRKIVGGFLVPAIEHMGPTLRFDVIEANFYGATLADGYGFDVLDLHFHFRFSLQHRMQDGVHWNALVHRKITCLLLEHAADAWGVELSNPDQSNPVNPPKPLQSCFQQNVTLNVTTCYQGAYNVQRYPSLPRCPAIPYNRDPAWNRQMKSSNSYGPPFFRDNLPPRLTAGYHRFEAQHGTGYRGGNRPNAASYWPEQNLEKRQRHRKRQDPYSHNRPRNFYR